MRSTGIHVHARRVAQVPVQDVAHLVAVALLMVRAEEGAIRGWVDEVLEEIVHQPTVSAEHSQNVWLRTLERIQFYFEERSQPHI